MLYNLYEGKLTLDDYRNNVFLGETIEFEEWGRKVFIEDDSELKEYVLLEINKDIITNVEE